jgi:hypothetical protein
MKSLLRIKNGLIALAGVAFACSANAVTVEITLPGLIAGATADSRVIGDTINNFSGSVGGAITRDVALVNALRPLPLNGVTTVDGQVVTRSDKNFGVLPLAVEPGALHSTGLPSDNGTLGDFKFEITLPTGFTYFVAAYDGPNGGAAAFYIGSLNAGDVLRVPQFAEPNGSPAHLLSNNNNFGLTGWSLINSTSNTTTVPDGGATVALLGLVLGALALVRRKMA